MYNISSIKQMTVGRFDKGRSPPSCGKAGQEFKSTIRNAVAYEAGQVGRQVIIF